jgi:uncharacterized Zn finger protein (UPF0148 family)
MTIKTCQICAHVDTDGAATCPRCGEASWSEVAAAPTRAKVAKSSFESDRKPQSAEEPEGDAQPKRRSRRSKKGQG